MKRLFSAFVALCALGGTAPASDVRTVFWSDAGVYVSRNVHFQGRWMLSREIHRGWGVGNYFQVDDKEVTAYLGPSFRLTSWASIGCGFLLSMDQNPLTHLGFFLAVRQTDTNPLAASIVLDDSGIDVDMNVLISPKSGVGLTVRDFERLGPRVEYTLTPLVRLWASPLYNWTEKSISGVVALKVSL